MTLAYISTPGAGRIFQYKIWFFNFQNSCIIVEDSQTIFTFFKGDGFSMQKY
jgi:hypothetical protein